MTAVLAEVLSAAAVGDVAEAVLIPLSKQGKLRVTYDWLYSALNCDPNDNSDFIWILTKVDANHVALSPKDPHNGHQLYASVRDDWSWFVQVQAPHSADWITAIGRNEIMLVEGADLLTISLKGWNNQYVTVNTDLSAHDWHAGFRLQSIDGGDKNARTFFLGVTQLLQPELALPVREELTLDQLQEMFGPGQADLAEYVHQTLR